MRIDPKARVGIALGLVLAFGAGVVVGGRHVPKPFPAGHVAPAPPRRPPAPPLVDDPIDGARVSPQLANRRPIGVMIDNHPEARPQWGLSLASRVYEALAEGGITRYLAIFGPNDGARVGPVRSTRTQFLDYALELGAAVAHVGGNADALALIPRVHVMDLDEFRYANAYRRISKSGIAFEHTMFTSTQALRALIDENAWQGDVSIDHPTWKSDIPAEARPSGQRVTIAFSTPEYTVSWVYQPAANDYERILAGTPDTDAATGSAITATSIEIAVVRRAHGRTRIGEDTWTFFDIGSGPAWVVQDGTAVPGTWRKASRTDRLRFFDEAGKEIALDRGPQWIEIVPPGVPPAFTD